MLKIVQYLYFIDAYNAALLTEYYTTSIYNLYCISSYGVSQILLLCQLLLNN